MKIAFFHGAFVNSGDFLICESAQKLLLKEFPNAEIREFLRGDLLDERIDEVNSCDILVLGGGPCFMEKFYPTSVCRMVSSLDLIKIPMMALGCGWYGTVANSASVRNYKFSPSTFQFWQKVTKGGLPLGCRDWYTFRILKNQGFNSMLMTGCPAWYNLKYLNQLEIRNDFLAAKSKICISDPACIENYAVLPELLHYLQERFPDASLEFVFHRGIYNENSPVKAMAKAHSMLLSFLKKEGIPWHDISGSAEGFRIYDDCSMHIGFRVHAHLYNLSVRNVSILLEEDGRGTGANNALGLFEIPTFSSSNAVASRTERLLFRCQQSVRYKSIKLFARGVKLTNHDMLAALDDYINMLEISGGVYMTHAFSTMQKTYEFMQRHIQSIPQAVAQYNKF